MNDLEGYRFLFSLGIFSWCLYSLATNHSNLSKGKKIAKIIVYWLITGFFLTASDYDKLTRLISLCLNLLFAIIAYYTVCDREIKENASNLKIEQVKPHIIFHSIYHYVKRITISWNPIWQYCANNKNLILITVAIIGILLLLPFYVEYFINNSGLSKRR